MNKKSNVPGAAQGAAPVEPPTIDQVEAWMKKDMACAISLLNALYSDPDMLRSIATFMMGRFSNAKRVVDQDSKSS